MVYSVVIVFTLIAVSSLVLAVQQQKQSTVSLPEMSPELNVGKLNYDVMCASCHGNNALGTDKGPTFLHRVYHPGHHGDQAFFLAPKQGVRAHHWPFGDMPPVEGITDQQIEKITIYIRALQKANGVF